MREKRINWLKHTIARYEETHDITYLIDAIGMLTEIVNKEQELYRQTNPMRDYEGRR